MQLYCLGFAFSQDLKLVALVLKNSGWQKGMFNGLGGKVESGERSDAAMVREFKEEAGISVIHNWRHFASLGGQDYMVHCFRGQVEDMTKINFQCDEGIIQVWPVCDLPANIIPNVIWLIQMALSFDKGEKAKAFSVNEIT